MPAGYSFGGFVAWEAARRLLEAGSKVDFVGLIDTRRGRDLEPQRTLLRKDWLSWSDGVALRRMLRLLLRLSAYATLRMVGRLAMLLPARAAFALHSHLIAELRLNALRQWTFEPQQIRATLFRSSEAMSLTPDFGWRALCEDLTMIPIGGSHTSLLEPPHREILCEHFLAALTQAGEHAARIDKAALSA